MMTLKIMMTDGNEVKTLDHFLSNADDQTIEVLFPKRLLNFSEIEHL